jgi:hypothetical protein
MAPGPPEERARARVAVARSPSARSLDQAHDPSARPGEPQMGLPQDPRGAPEARHRRLGDDHRHGAPRRRTRAGAASDRPHLGPVPTVAELRRALPRASLRPGGRPPGSRGGPAGAEASFGERRSSRRRPHEPIGKVPLGRRATRPSRRHPPTRRVDGLDVVEYGHRAEESAELLVPDRPFTFSSSRRSTLA